MILRGDDKTSNMLLSQNQNSKKAKLADAPHLENALYRWICTHSNRGVVNNSKIIYMEGKRLKDAVDALLSHDN